jgi:endonuclease/exonuclease/phosphatase family metal-dependent hydrolase
VRIASFNVQNMRLRVRDGSAHLDGARDEDLEEDIETNAVALDGVDRRLTAAVLKAADADVVSLQEVFNQETLDYFHDTVLVPGGVPPYPYRVCLPGNDGRGLNVAVMSRLPIDDVTGHAAETPSSLGLNNATALGPDDRIFRRDCLEVSVGRLTAFVCHFKAPYPDTESVFEIRRLEATAVRRLIERRFDVPAENLWLILGDLNEPAVAETDPERTIAPVFQDFAVDLLSRTPSRERWTFHQPHSTVYTCPDALLASPALAAQWPNVRPEILRIGLDRAAERYKGARLAGVGAHRPHASDHAALSVNFPGL